jgi:hypothetical protein
LGGCGIELVGVNKSKQRQSELLSTLWREANCVSLARSSSSSCRNPFPSGCANVDAAPNYLCKPFDDSAICAFSKFGRRCSQLLRFALIRIQTTSYTPCLFPSRFARRFSLGGCLFSGDFSSLATVLCRINESLRVEHIADQLRFQKG